MAYTYRVTIIPTGQFYIGSQYGKRANPSNLGSSYFTSSSVVQNLIFEHGKGNVSFEILKIATKEECLKEEYNLIRQYATEQSCLNRQIDENFRQIIRNAHVNGSYMKRNKNQSEHMKRMWQNPEFKTIMSKKNETPRKTTDEERKQKSEILKSLHKKGLCKYDHAAGTIWINDGVSSKRVPKSSIIPEGFSRGRGRR